MTNEFSRREVLGATTASFGLTLSPSILSKGGGAIERTHASDTNLHSTESGSLPAARRSVLYLRHPDAPAVAAPPNQQFVFLEVDSEGLDVEDVPSASDFVFRVGDEVYRGGRNVEGLPVEGALMWAHGVKQTPYVGRERWVETDTDVTQGSINSREVGSGVLAFAVPLSIDTDDVAVELKAPKAEEVLATWTFDRQFVDALERPPSFEITSFEVPNQIKRGVKAPLSVSVRNDGGRKGTFAAVFGIDRAEHPKGIEFQVPTESEVTWDGFVQYPPTFETVDGAATQVEYVLDIGHARLRRSIDVLD